MSGEKSEAIIQLGVDLLIIIAFIAFILRSNKRTVTEPPQSEQADVANIKWEIKSTEWPLGEARNCVFFPSGFGSGFAGCWHEYDESTGVHNRNHYCPVENCRSSRNPQFLRDLTVIPAFGDLNSSGAFSGLRAPIRPGEIMEHEHRTNRLLSADGLFADL